MDRQGMAEEWGERERKMKDKCFKSKKKRDGRREKCNRCWRWRERFAFLLLPSSSFSLFSTSSSSPCSWVADVIFSVHSNEVFHVSNRHLVFKVCTLHLFLSSLDSFVASSLSLSFLVVLVLNRISLTTKNLLQACNQCQVCIHNPHHLSEALSRRGNNWSTSFWTSVMLCLFGCSLVISRWRWENRRMKWNCGMNEWTRLRVSVCWIRCEWKEQVMILIDLETIRYSTLYF